MLLPTRSVSDPVAIAGGSPVSRESRDLLQRRNTLPSAGTGSASFIRKWLRSRKAGREDTSTARQAKRADSKIEDLAVNIENAIKTVYPPDANVITDEDLDYDSLSLYFVDQCKEKEFVRSELRRLAKVVENPEIPLIFAGSEQLGGRGNKREYHALETLRKLISKVKTICTVDNDGISLVHAPLGLTPGQFQSSLYRLQPSGTMLRSLQAKSEAGQVDDEMMARFTQDASALLDFISAAMARLMSQIASGDSWRNSQLGVLAKFTAKTKFLLRNIDEYSSISFQNGELALASFREAYATGSENKDSQESDPDTVFQRFAGSLSADPEQAAYLRSTEYRADQQKIRVGFTQVLDYVIASLLPNTRHRGFGITEYEVCGVVLETGFHDFQTLLFQDRDFEFTSTSDLDQLNIAHPAF